MPAYTIAVGQNPNTVFASAVPGDVITFAAGTHDDYAVTVSCSGDASTPIEVRGEPGAILRHPDGQAGTGYALTVTGDYLYIHDLICEEAAKAVVVDGASHVKLQRIEGRNTRDESFKVRNFSSYIYLDDCYAHDSGSGGQFGEGFYIGDASSNWPNTSTPDTTNHIRLDGCTSVRCYGDGVDIKEGATDVVVKGHSVDFSQGNAPPEGASFGDSGYYSRGDRVQFINCTVLEPGEYGFKCYDVVVGAVTYGREQYVKGGSSAGHSLGGVGSQSDAPSGMHVYSDFTADAPRIDEVGGGWDPDYSNLDPATFTEYSWSSPAATYEPSGEEDPGGGSGGPPVVDASSPPRVQIISGTAMTTASFNPPADSLLVACCYTGDNGGSENNSITMSNNGAATTWELIGRRREAGDVGALSGLAEAWYTTLSSARTGMTVTATINVAHDCCFKLYVFTNVDLTDPIGGYAEGSSTALNFTSAALTQERADSLGLCVANDWSIAGTPSSSDLTEDVGKVNTTVSGFTGYKQLAASAGGSQTCNIQSTGSGPDWNYLWFEIKASAAPVDTGAWLAFFN